MVVAVICGRDRISCPLLLTVMHKRKNRIVCLMNPIKIVLQGVSTIIGQNYENKLVLIWKKMSKKYTIWDF
jgi:hypothetical protein